MKKQITPLVLSLLASAACHALTFDLTIVVGGNSALFPANSKALIVADTNGDGFQGASASYGMIFENILSGGTFNVSYGDMIGTGPSPDDAVIATITDLTDLSTLDPEFASLSNGFFYSNTFTLEDVAAISGWNTGDPLAIFWFPNGTANWADDYYFFRSDDGGNRGFDPWVTPSDEGAGFIVSVTDDPTMGFGTLAPLTVPEPSAALVLAAAGATFVLRRRR